MRSAMKNYVLFVLVLLFQISCGGNNQDSSKVAQKGPSPNFAAKSKLDSSVFGNSVKIKEYLRKIDPLIVEYSQIQSKIYGVMGSSGVFTGRNLGQITKDQKPRLLELSEKLEAIEPPPLIAPFHNDFAHLLVLRLSAFDAAIQALEIEDASGDTSAFSEVSLKFALSEEQIVKLNQQMQEINESLLSIEQNRIATP